MQFREWKVRARDVTHLCASTTPVDTIVPFAPLPARPPDIPGDSPASSCRILRELVIGICRSAIAVSGRQYLFAISRDYRFPRSGTVACKP